MNVSIYDHLCCVYMSLCIYVALALCISYVSVRVTFRRSKRSLEAIHFPALQANPRPYLSIILSIYLSVCLSVYQILSIYLSIYSQQMDITGRKWDV